MPGFTSFLIAHTHATPSRPTTPESDSEAEVIRKLLRRKTRREATQLTTIYGMHLRRADVSSIHNALVQLKRDIEAQIELFHDAGISNLRVRKGILREFARVNKRVLRDGVEILDRLGSRTGTGVVGDLRNGLEDLERVMDERGGGEEEMEEMSLEWAGRIVRVLRGVEKGVGEIVREFGRARSGWK